MSRRASRRSVKVSSSRISSSSSVEISESVTNVLKGVHTCERENEDGKEYRCPYIRLQMKGRSAWTQRTHPRPLLVRPL